MTDVTDAAPAGLGIRGSRRRSAAGDGSLITTSRLEGSDRLPLVVRPARPGVDLADWAANNYEQVQSLIHEHGVLMFRGFDLRTAEAFERAAGALAGEGLYGDYGDLPREVQGEKIFGSTPYPADQMIFFHNESSHMAHWPMRIFFYSQIAAETGGATPLVDCRESYRTLDPEVRDAFETNGLLYTRNFAAGIDVPWQSFFGTDDQALVEAKCTEAGTGFEWLKGGDQLRISQRCDAVHTHPVTGDKVFFNQVLLHHPAALPPETRSALLSLLDVDDLPRNCYYGDGSVIPDEVIAHVFDVYGRIGVHERWNAGEMMMIDNMLACHGRDPFTGSRKILVGMAQMH
ncbi:MAG: TauD/TfdA family dioxygenase [Actinomycetota bacterium]